MKSATIFIALIVLVCLIGLSNAWGFRSRSRYGNNNNNNGSNSNSSRYGDERGNRYRWRNNRNYTRYGPTYILVRRVDEPHPYFRTLNVSSNSSLADLKTSLGEFFNKSAENITMLVLNDKLLLTLDAEARMLKSKDQLEVTFSDSGAPTRAKTGDAYSKDARKSRWPDKKEKEEKKDKKDKKKAGGRGRSAESDVEDEIDEEMMMEDMQF